jgi:1,4-dihydroxy-2-naphthoate octaprenyltransferase
VVLGAAALVALYLVWVAGWPLAVIAVISLVLALAYTGGPFPLAYHGLGDLFVLIFFGIVAVAGTHYVQTLHWSVLAIWAGVAVGLIATAILVVNNLRDRHTDAVANKKTLVVRFGPAAARWEYTLCMVGAYLVPLGLWSSGLVGPFWMLSWISLPLAIHQTRAIWTTDGAALNPHLGGTARVELLFALLLSGGMFL